VRRPPERRAVIRGSQRAPIPLARRPAAGNRLSQEQGTTWRDGPERAPDGFSEGADDRFYFSGRPGPATPITVERPFWPNPTTGDRGFRLSSTGITPAPPSACVERSPRARSITSATKSPRLRRFGRTSVFDDPRGRASGRGPGSRVWETTAPATNRFAQTDGRS